MKLSTSLALLLSALASFGTAAPPAILHCPPNDAIEGSLTARRDANDAPRSDKVTRSMCNARQAECMNVGPPSTELHSEKMKR